jgi:hypothetical protein
MEVALVKQSERKDCDVQSRKIVDEYGFEGKQGI